MCSVPAECGVQAYHFWSVSVPAVPQGEEFSLSVTATNATGEGAATSCVATTCAAVCGRNNSASNTRYW